MKYLSLFSGFLFILLGFAMKKAKQNPLFGIRTTWTLDNEENWNRTHQFSSILWIVCGLITTINFFFQSNIIFFSMILIVALGPILYSYWFYRMQLKSGERNKAKYSIISVLFFIIIFLFVGVSLFTGNVKYNCTERVIQIQASQWKDYEIEYKDIQSIHLEKNVEAGIRTFGLGNLKVGMGDFRNDAYGDYIRYAYASCDEYIVIETKNNIVVINDQTEEKTEKLYKEIETHLKKKE
ncbi:MAG: SdpI family protein [Bacillota bacterium]|nr:SdpI family protein [Bacillota bacterium]